MTTELIPSILTLTVSDVKQFIYCPRVVYFTYALPGHRPTTYKMEDGKLEHDHTAELEERRSLRAYGLTEGERQFNISLHSRRLGLSGKLDMVISTPFDRLRVLLLRLSRWISNSRRVAWGSTTNTSWRPMPVSTCRSEGRILKAAIENIPLAHSESSFNLSIRR